MDSMPKNLVPGVFSQKPTSRAGQFHRIFLRVGVLQYKVQHHLASEKSAANLARELIRLAVQLTPFRSSGRAYA